MTGPHTRTLTRVAVPDFAFVVDVFNHHPCGCNEEIAIRNRVIGEVPLPTVEGLDIMRLGLEAIVRHLPKTTAISYGEVLAPFSGQRKAKYSRAVDRVLEWGFSARMAGCTMFIKNEKLMPLKVNPDPRAIQFRDPRFCVEISRYLKPIEKHLYELHGVAGSSLPPDRLVGKGLNQVERAMTLLRKVSRFARPVVLSLDLSRFDQHVAAEVLRMEHAVYLRCNNDPYFAWLLSLQVHNLVRTASGWRYRTNGKRMSGDMNTALGNCILMIMMVVGFCLKHLPTKRWDLFDDGDDCLLIVEEEDLRTVLETAPPTFLSFGQELKIEKIARSFAAISWCQSSPIEYLPGKWKFVRDPVKAMSSALVTNKFKTSLKGRNRLMATIGLGELILNLGVPVLQEFAVAIIRNAQGARWYDDRSYYNYPVLREMKMFGMRQIRMMCPAQITDEARLSFSRAFGISIDYQYAIESALSSWTIAMQGDVAVASTWDAATWTNLQDCHPERYL